MTANLPALVADHATGIEPYDPDEQLRRILGPTLRLALALLAIVTLACALIPIGGAIIGQGEIGVQSRVKTISHPAGGTIAAILVENGQRVRKGQILMRLDDKVAGSDAQLMALSVDQMVAQKARLEAEIMGANGVAFPSALTARHDESAAKAIANERHMFAIRRAEQAGLIAQLRSRVGEYGQEIGGYRAQIASLHQQRTLIEPERKGVRDLYEKKLVTLNRLNQLERTAVDLEGSMGALNAQIAQAEAKISETQQQIIQLGQTRRSEAGQQLAAISNQLNDKQVQRISAVDIHDRTLIRAPVDGYVEKLAFSTVGGVIRGGEPIMTIVPAQDRLIVEGAISPTDIDQAHVGQPARVRLSALSITATPELHGKVIYVGAERITDPDGKRTYFPVRVMLDPRDSADTKELKPGLPAEIFIETKERSMLSYVTKPLRDQFARAFKD